jgi:hypothetical protein
MKKSIKILLVVVVVLGTVGVGLHTNIIKLPLKVRTGSATFLTDLGDNRYLLGASHNVFVGKVMQQIGSEPWNGHLATQFAVEVVYNIKGNLQGTVAVDQEGRYVNGIQYLSEDERELFQPGTTYLFSTRHAEKKIGSTMLYLIRMQVRLLARIRV